MSNEGRWNIEKFGRLGWAVRDPEGNYVTIDGRVLVSPGKAVAALLDRADAQRQ